MSNRRARPPRSRSLGARIGIRARRPAARPPVLAVFLDTVSRCSIPHEYPLERIEGMRMDLEQARYRTFDDLRVFCYRVASVVGSMMSHVIGFAAESRDEVHARATELGFAMQIANILRGIGEDRDRGRVYLPQEDLDRFGCSESSLRARVRNPAFEALMRLEAARARAFHESARPGVALLSPGGRFAVHIASDVYSGILSRIEASRYDVFSSRACVPATRKYWIAARRLAGRALAAR